jgi:hypothetical protein
LLWVASVFVLVCLIPLCAFFFFLEFVVLFKNRRDRCFQNSKHGIYYEHGQQQLERNFKTLKKTIVLWVDPKKPAGGKKRKNNSNTPPSKVVVLSSE